MSEELDFGPSVPCPSCARIVPIADPDDPRLTCPRCGHRWKRSVRAAVRPEERDPAREESHEVDSLPSPTLVLGAALYFAGAVIAFCGLPRLDGAAWPTRGAVGVIGAVLLGFSPRAGMMRSFGLICVWLSGLFIGRHPVVFLVGAGLLVAGMALANLNPPSATAEESEAPSDAGAR